MTSVHSGLPSRGYKAESLISNPFDSDDDDGPSVSSSSRITGPSSASSSSRFTNPFEDTGPFPPVRKTNTKPVDSGRHGANLSSNPFDNEESVNPSKRVVENGSTAPKSSRRSSRSHSEDLMNPFNDAVVTSKSTPAAPKSSRRSSRSHSEDLMNPFNDAEVTSKTTPANHSSASPSQSILDNGSLFDDEEVQSTKPAKTKSSFTKKIKEGGSKIKESVSAVKMPQLPQLPQLSQRSSASSADDKSEGSSKNRKSKQHTKELMGDLEPGYKSSTRNGGGISSQGGYGAGQQNNYFMQSEEQRFAGQTVEELEQHALTKSQDVTSSIKNCIRVAEETKGTAAGTLEMLHDQGEQIRRTHETALNVDDELSRSEKLLGSLGGLFSRNWKPKKTRQITGPTALYENPAKLKLNPEIRRELLNSDQPKKRVDYSGMTVAQAQLAMEKNQQDEALDDLSNVMTHLKEMTVDMGNELGRQNVALEQMHDDIHELNFRVKGANNRTRNLLGR